jgi:hypothetical protein
MTGSVASDGQTPITGNLQMGGNKITGMANGTALTDAATVGQAVPSGAILMWSGSIASVPTGWYLCDGTNGTPDLRNRFIVGAGSTYAVNATGGSADAIVVAHTHTGTTSTVDINHTHYFAATTDGMDRANPHTHNIYGPNGGGGNPGGDLNTSAPLSQQVTYTDINHAHNVSGDTGYMNSNNTHNHTFTTASSGSSGTNANLPPYLALAYIMKA